MIHIIFPILIAVQLNLAFVSDHPISWFIVGWISAFYVVEIKEGLVDNQFRKNVKEAGEKQLSKRYDISLFDDRPRLI